MGEDLAPRDIALQQGRTPRPLPLFLELIRDVSTNDPGLAQRALRGLTRYQREERALVAPHRSVCATVDGAVLRDYGGSGPPVVLIPSLINPPRVLDFPGQSLAEALTVRNRVLLLDWGPAAKRTALDLGEHVTGLLVPLLDAIGEPASLIGYCLGGTMAIAAAGLTTVRRVATLAAPWRFDAYPCDALTGLERLWRRAEPASDQLGMLPTEVLQAAFWSLDSRGVVAKFAALADEPEGSLAASRFVTLEDWANDGEALPLPAARELIETLFLANASGTGQWSVGGRTVDPLAHPRSISPRRAIASSPQRALRPARRTPSHRGMSG